MKLNDWRDTSVNKTGLFARYKEGVSYLDGGEVCIILDEYKVSADGSITGTEYFASYLDIEIEGSLSFLGPFKTLGLALFSADLFLAEKGYELVNRRFFGED